MAALNLVRDSENFAFASPSLLDQTPAGNLGPLLPTARVALRIVHTISGLSPDAGGPSTVVTRLAAAQALQGHHVSIISNLAEADQAKFRKSVASIPGFTHVSLIVSKSASDSVHWFGTRMRPIYEAAFRFCDIVHLHGVWEPMLLIAGSRARAARVPYVVRPCGMLDPWSLSRHAWKKRLALSLTHRRMLDGAAFIHALNQDESDRIVPLNLKSRNEIIPNAVNLAEVDDLTGESEFRSSCPNLGSHPYILFLSRLHEKKGIDVLAAAFVQIAARFPEMHLVVAGPDEGEGNVIRAELKAANLAKRLHMPGPIYGAAKFAAMRGAECFCLPSRQEGFSLAITEALASRTPAVISTDCHFPEVDDVGAGRIFELSVDAAATALADVLNASPLQRIDMGRAGRDLVMRHFTWDRVAAQTINAYENVLTPSR